MPRALAASDQRPSLSRNMRNVGTRFPPCVASQSLTGPSKASACARRSAGSTPASSRCDESDFAATRRLLTPARLALAKAAWVAARSTRNPPLVAIPEPWPSGDTGPDCCNKSTSDTNRSDASSPCTSASSRPPRKATATDASTMLSALRNACVSPPTSSNSSRSCRNPSVSRRLRNCRSPMSPSSIISSNSRVKISETVRRSDRR